MYLNEFILIIIIVLRNPLNVNETFEDSAFNLVTIIVWEAEEDKKESCLQINESKNYGIDDLDI